MKFLLISGISTAVWHYQNSKLTKPHTVSSQAPTYKWSFIKNPGICHYLHKESSWNKEGAAFEQQSNNTEESRAEHCADVGWVSLVPDLAPGNPACGIGKVSLAPQDNSTVVGGVFFHSHFWRWIESTKRPKWICPSLESDSRKNTGTVYSCFSPSKASLTRQSKNCILGLTYFWTSPSLCRGVTNLKQKINEHLHLYKVVTCFTDLLC